MNNINILGIDPGSNFIGVTILNLSLEKDRFLSINSITPLLIDVSLEENNYIGVDTLYYRLNKMKEQLSRILLDLNVTHIAIENSFINRFRPQAYGPLSKSIVMLEDTIYNTNPFIKIFKYPPSNIKIAVNANFKANKDAITIALENINEISNFINPRYLTEHENDATAIAYTLLQDLRKYKELLCLI